MFRSQISDSFQHNVAIFTPSSQSERIIKAVLYSYTNHLRKFLYT